MEGARLQILSLLENVLFLLQSPKSVSKNDRKQVKEEEKSEEMELMTIQEKIAAKILTTEKVYFEDGHMTPK